MVSLLIIYSAPSILKKLNSFSEGEISGLQLAEDIAIENTSMGLVIDVVPEASKKVVEMVRDSETGQAIINENRNKKKLLIRHYEEADIDSY